jgi:beta-phosphoglucomutase-like phosphatase (HAD superfamily)
MKTAATPEPFSVVFFDIGGTLGTVQERAGTRQLEVFATSITLLQTLRDVLSLRLGIISNIPSDMSSADVRTMLATAGLLTLIDDDLIVTSRDAGAAKPDARIYEVAAERAQISIGRCIYIGENPSEVTGAQAAGMGGLIKPLPVLGSVAASGSLYPEGYAAIGSRPAAVAPGERGGAGSEGAYPAGKAE